MNNLESSGPATDIVLGWEETQPKTMKVGRKREVVRDIATPRTTVSWPGFGYVGTGDLSVPINHISMDVRIAK